LYPIHFVETIFSRAFPYDDGYLQNRKKGHRKFVRF